MQLKKIILFLLCQIGSFSALAQEKSKVALYTDSLLQIALAQTTDSAKFQRFLDISYFLSERDTAKAFHYFREAKKYTPTNNDYYKGILYFYSAGIYYDHDILRAKTEYLQAEDLLSKYKTKEAFHYRARLWNNFGALLQRQGYADQYIEALINRAIPYAKESKDTVLVGNNYQNVAMIFMNMLNYDKADIYYKEAIEFLSKSEDAHEEKLTVFVNATKNALFQKNLIKAKKYLDSADIHANATVQSTFLPIYESTRGTYYRLANQPGQSLSHLEKGLKLASEMNNTYYINAILYEKFELYNQLKDYASAKNMLTEVYANVKNSASMRDKQLVTYKMAQTEAKLGNYKSAFDWFELHKIYADSLYFNESEMKITELEKKYQTIEKENEILKLKNENQDQYFALEKQKILIGILIGGLLIALLLSFLGWKLYQNKKRYTTQQEQLYQQELTAIKQQEQIKIYDSMIHGQEQERNRIARDLHDGLGGLLAGVKLKLSAIAFKKEETVQLNDTEIQQVIFQLDHSVDELRRIARNMMPESLLYMGLESALRDLCTSLNNNNTSVKFQSYDLKNNYSQTIQITVYRIIQELLTNAIKHAQAKNIMVQCIENQHQLYITVEDDGIGFNKNSPAENKGIGLSNIENRVSILNGNVEIESVKNEGTTFNINIPLHGK